MAGLFAPRSELEITVEHIGEEEQPVVIVENCLAAPDALIEAATGQQFSPIGPYYPGVRLPVSAGQVAPLLAPIADRLEQVFALPRTLRYLEGFLSLVTTAPSSLLPIQRLPHFDGLEPERLAILLYLDRKQRGGTAFYRQRETGFESVDSERFPQYQRSLQDGVKREGLPAAEYIGKDNPLFERTCEMEDLFNRMIVYRGNTLHCAALPKNFEPDPDPATGRLSLNLFLTAA